MTIFIDTISAAVCEPLQSRQRQERARNRGYMIFVMICGTRDTATGVSARRNTFNQPGWLERCNLLVVCVGREETPSLTHRAPTWLYTRHGN